MSDPLTHERDQWWLAALHKALIAKKRKRDLPGERLTADSDPDVRARHVARYERAIGLVERAKWVGPTWWDVACGDGYGTEILPVSQPVGFDKDPGALAAAWGRRPGARFHQVDLESPGWWLPEHSRPDAVLCIETLEHLPRELQARLIYDFATVLHPHRGVLVLACPIGNGPSAVNPWHLHEPTEDELRDMLTAHFGDVTIEAEEYVSTSGPAVQAFAVCRA